MANKFVYVEGELHWMNNVFVPDTKFPHERYPEKGGRRHLEMRLDKDQFDHMKKSNLSHRVKVDPETMAYIYKPSSWEYGRRRDGTLFEQKVEVVDKDGNPWPEDVTIGNGSRGIVKLETYKATYNNNTTTEANLVRVQVTDLVEYVRPEEDENTSSEESSDDIEE